MNAVITNSRRLTRACLPRKRGSLLLQVCGLMARLGWTNLPGHVMSSPPNHHICRTPRTSCLVRSATRVRRQNRAPETALASRKCGRLYFDTRKWPVVEDLGYAGCREDRIDDDEGRGLWEVDVGDWNVEEGWWPALFQGVVQMLIGFIPRGRKYGECPVSALIQLTASGGMSGEGSLDGSGVRVQTNDGMGDVGWMDVAPIFFPFLFHLSCFGYSFSRGCNGSISRTFCLF